MPIESLPLKQFEKEIAAQDKRWFYKKKKSQVTYNNSGKGSLSIPKLVQSKPCFKNFEPDAAWAKKTVILSDWNMQNRDVYQVDEINALIKALLDEGINIHIWQKNQLIPLQGPVTREQRRDLSPVANHILIEKAAQINIPKDQLYILDYDEINRLMEGKDTSDSKIKVMNYLPIADKEQLLKSYQQTPPRIIFCDTNLPEANELAETLKEAFQVEVVHRIEEYSTFHQPDDLSLEQVLAEHPTIKHLHVAKKHKEIAHPIDLPSLEKLTLYNSELSAESLNNLLAHNASKLLFLDLGSNSLKEPESLARIVFPSLKYFSIDAENTNFSANVLCSLFQNMPQLKDLIICQKMSGFPPQIALPSLEKLCLIETNFFREDLNHLLNSTPKLKELSFINYQFSGVPPEISLPFLEELHLDGSNISSAELKVFLTKSSNLKVLNLKSTSQLSAPLSNISLPSLERLDLMDSSITGDNLSALLSEALKLKSLDLQRWISSSDIKFPLKLPSLEKLNLGYSTITGISLNHLLEKASQLKTLKLSGCQQLVDLNPQISLPSLEELDVDRSNISIEALKAILESAPKLKSLTCSEIDCSKLSDTLSKFFSLEKLSLGHTNLSSEAINKLIANNAAHLKHFTLWFYDDFSSIDFQVPLPSLEELFLNGCNISSEQLNPLLNQSSKLIKLDLAHCKNSLTTINKVSLPALKTLNAGYSSISTQSLYNILNDATRLEYLYLENCTNLAETIPPISLPSLEGLYLGNETNISVQSVYNLIINAKNLRNLVLPSQPQFQKDQLPEPFKKLLEKIPYVTYSEESEPSASSEAEPAQFLPPLFFSSKKTANTPKTWDADTEKNSESLPAQLHFFPLNDKVPEEAYPVRDYRLNAYNKLKLAETCSLKDAFVLENQGDLALQACEVLRVSSAELEQAKLKASTEPKESILGIDKLIVGPEWVALPSLKVGERITHLCTEPEGNTIELQYSERDSLYYIRSEEPFFAHLKFLVELPEPREEALPEEIEQLRNKYLNYQEGSLELGEGPLTGADYLHALQTQNKGACRHRAIAFKAEIEQKYPSRIIDNEVHAFVEVFYDEHWVRCDLGGYDTELKLDHSLQEKPKSAQPASLPTVDLFAGVTLRPEYLKLFATWESVSVQKPGLKEFCQKQLQNTAQKKKLIELNNNQDTQALQAALYQHCKNTSKPVFCINSLDDLICSAPYMLLSDPVKLKGSLVKGPGGPLYEFLKAPYTKDNPPVLLVNLNDKDLVLFNALLENNRKADGIDVPESALIIGLLNSQKNKYGSDFGSRFDEKSLAPFESEDLASFQAQPLADYQGQKDVFKINLFHDSEWRERLLGRWVMKETGLEFEEGLLIQALRAQKPIVIENGPWEDGQFQQFCHNLQLTKTVSRPMGAPDLTLPLPQILRSEGYDWAKLGTCIEADRVFEAGGLTLNPTQLGQLFQRYECKGKSLSSLPGWMQQHALSSPKTPLHLNLTRDLSEDAWAECLSYAQELKLELKLHCAPGINPPAFLKSQLSPDALADEGPWPDCAFSSTDPDTTILNLGLKEKPLVFDISECDESDLLEKITGGLNQETLQFDFELLEGALLVALKEGKTVILTGNFSDELQDALADFLLRRKAEKNPSGQVLLVSQEPLYSFMPVTHQSISVADKLQHLKVLDRLAEQKLTRVQLESESLAQLKARLVFLKQHPGTSSDKAWDGLYKLSSGLVLEPLDFKKSKSQARAFTQKRLAAVQGLLAQQPFVFLSGLTGVGKTTFVSKYLGKEAHLYQDESQIKLWALNKDPKTKILFIDEANLSNKLWSELEGLFHDPKGILIEGVYYPLDEYHKVIFAGNPLSYGDDRSLAPFFARHGNALVFDPLPLAVIYEDLLRPLFESEPRLAAQAPLCSEPILKAYRFLCQCSTEEVLISPRELQMMGLLTLAYCNKYPEADPQKAAEYYSYQLAQSLVPEEHQAAFKASFPKPEDLVRTEVARASNFLITPSRVAIQNTLEDLLMLRAFKRASTQSIQQYGGLGGMVLEGEPGIGKSELLTEVLVRNGYQEVHSPYTQEQVPELAFYRMPPSMGLEEKEQLLLKAFHEGSVVVIDEINSAPMMERLLNSLLMGSTPEGEKAKNPGFMIIGTQNPITMAGRIAASTALSRRMLKVELPPYTPVEMIEILKNKGLEEERAKELVLAYTLQRKQAKDKGLSPEPCFRDLLKSAEALLKGASKIPLDLIDEPIEPQPLPDENIKAQKKEQKPNYHFLFKATAVLSASLGLAAFVVAILALTLVLSISTAGIGVLFGVSVGAAALSLGLFKVGQKNKSTAEVEEKPENDPSF